MGREDTQAFPLCPFSARKMVQVQPMRVSPGMPASRPWPGTRPRHPSPRYERAGAFQRPTAPSPHGHLRSQNATVETGDKVPRSPIGCCFCASQNTCHPCQMLERPGLLSEPRHNHGDTLSTKATQRRCTGQSPVRVSPQQVNPNTAPWATPVVTHTQGCSVCLRKLLDSTRRCSIRTRPSCSLRSLCRWSNQVIRTPGQGPRPP